MEGTTETLKSDGGSTLLNKKLTNEGSDFQLLAGSEVDILTEGKLDFDNDLLAQLDGAQRARPMA